MLEYIGSICIYNMIEYTAPILLDAIILIWLIFIFIIYAVAGGADAVLGVRALCSQSVFK